MLSPLDEATRKGKVASSAPRPSTNCLHVHAQESSPLALGNQLWQAVLGSLEEAT